MMLEAVISNADHPEYGVATIPFPIPKEQYDQCIEMVKALEIGDPFKKDCKVVAIDSAFSVLKITENLRVNLDELDYLAKRLESFDVGEAAQFQAMASKLELFELQDLINLTFCCQQATVITDFSDLEQIGRDHYMNLHGGCASLQELEDLDGAETAILLIDSGGGTITRYGVVYDNGMKLEQSYDGKHFPAYLYEPCMLMVALTSQKEPEDTENITWLYLPAAKGQIERAMERSGIEVPTDMRFRFGDSMLPTEVDAALDFKYVCSPKSNPTPSKSRRDQKPRHGDPHGDPYATKRALELAIQSRQIKPQKQDEPDEQEEASAVEDNVEVEIDQDDEEPGEVRP